MNFVFGFAVAPEARKVHAAPVFSLDVARQGLEGPQMIVRVNRWDRIESGLDAPVSGGLPRVEGLRRRQRGEKEAPNSHECFHASDHAWLDYDWRGRMLYRVRSGGPARMGGRK